MIDPALAARIRRFYYAEHWRIGTIAAELGVHHDTVAHAIGRDRLGRPSPARPVRPSALDPYKPLLAEILEQHPRLRATRLHAMVAGRGFGGGVITVRRYVRTIRPTARAEAYLRLTTLPGEQGQVDWGHFGTLQVGHARRPLVCFVLVLSWSRALRPLRARPGAGELPPRACRGLCGPGRDATDPAVRQPQERGAGARGRPRPLPPPPAGTRGPLPLRAQALRPVPRQ